MPDLNAFITPERLLAVLYAVITLVVGVAVARLARSLVRRASADRLSPQGMMLLSRVVFFVILGLVFSSVLHQLGFKLGVLLGAAGILTVAIGFASQTSASNLISGLFVIAERPFVVGDVIKIDDLVGEVLSIDLLSAKLRTFDNLYVRVPNESIIKSRITNLTYFPIRRLDIQMGVAYREDIEKTKEVLFKVADQNPLCLDEPKPLFIFQKFGDSALEFQFSVWATRVNFLDLRNGINSEIKAAFDEAGIEIPFPHRTIYMGEGTGPLPISMEGTSEGKGFSGPPAGN
ncbi:MAG: mechanosensitive ion channel family protein [Candidatus Eisenbacteria bacterium]|uniref:Mechanosensitive ion channel family protein n=1 Tax=Eiseniibacteriota bacterium TaxID=2212470 RepID=A0A7Y2E790_UNCEI|nr:mechanosensitive ion channel family protein [Candidatus Eisenbacteria bacterium]